MGLDDLLRDRKPKAGVLPEALLRSIGVEAVEDLVDGVRPDARTGVVDQDLDRVPHALAGHLHDRARGREGAGVVDQVGDHLRQPGVVAEHQIGVAALRRIDHLELHSDAVLARRPVLHVDHRGQQLDHVDRLGVLPLKLGVEPARVGNVADQPVEPAHVVLDDAEQPLARLLCLGKRQRLDGGAQRGQRVLELMGDVGGEALDRFDPRVERARHVAQRPGQMADFVRALGEVRDLGAVLVAVAHALRAVRELAHRPGDRAGQQQRQHEHHGGRDQEHAHDREALGLHYGVDVAALRRQQQHAGHRPEALHRHRDRDDDLARVVDPHDALRRARQRLRDLRIAAAVARAELRIERKVRAPKPALDGAADLVEQPRIMGLGRRQVEAQDVAAGVERARVEQQRAVAVVDARAGPGRRHKPAQHRSDALGIDREFEALQPLVARRGGLPGLEFEQLVGVDIELVGLDGRRGGDRARDDLALDQQALDAGVDQPGAELVEVEDARDQRDEAGEVQNDDAPGQAREAEDAQGAERAHDLDAPWLALAGVLVCVGRDDVVRPLGFHAHE